MKNEIIIDGVRWRNFVRTYYVSETGYVANIKIKDNNIIHFRQLKFDKNKNNNYSRVPIKYEPQKEKKYLVHRLVYKLFIGELNDNLVIDHIDGNPSNNHYKNLRQVTQKENIKNAMDNGKFGNNHNISITVFDKETNTINKYNSIKEFLSTLDINIGSGSLNELKKYKKYKNRFEIVKEGQETIEKVSSEKDTRE